MAVEQQGAERERGEEQQADDDAPRRRMSAPPRRLQRLGGHRIADPLGDADVRRAAALLDPGGDLVAPDGARRRRAPRRSSRSGPAARGCAGSGRWRARGPPRARRGSRPRSPRRRAPPRASATTGSGASAGASARKNRVSKRRVSRKLGHQRANGVSAARVDRQAVRGEQGGERLLVERCPRAAPARSPHPGAGSEARREPGLLDRLADRRDPRARRSPKQPRRCDGRRRRSARRERPGRPPRTPCRRSARSPAARAARRRARASAPGSRRGWDREARTSALC